MISNVKVQKKSDDKYFIFWLGTEKTTVYLLSGPNKKNIERKIVTTSHSGVEVTVDNYLRPYFLLEDTAQQVVTSTRVVPLEGANNFRDLGGYPTKDGKVTKWGKLFRSDHLHRLTNDDLNVLEEIGIRTIIDYRREDEYKNQPNKTWSSLNNTFHVDPAAERAVLAAKASSTKEKVQHLVDREVDRDVSFDDSGKTMIEQAKDFVRLEDNKRAYRQVLDIALNEKDIPIDQHCRGGKDRTGYGVAIILYLLGVDLSYITQDFMLTKKLRENRNNRRMAQYENETDDPNILSYLYSMLDTRPEYLSSSFEEMIEISGSVDEYFKNELSVTQEEIQKLRKLYVETNNKV